MVQSTQKTLSSLKKLAEISQERFTDKRYGELFSRMITKEIEKTDLMLVRLRDYIRLTSPIPKVGTIQKLIEELVKKHALRIADRKVQLTTKLAKDLPETRVPDEPLRYLLDSLLRYCVTVAPAGGSIELSTERKEQWIEVRAAIGGLRKAENQKRGPLPISITQVEELLDLELQLMNEILKRNRGEMRCEVDESGARTLVSLRLPIERRRILCYPSKEPR